MLFWITVIALALICGAVLARAAIAGHAGGAAPADYDLRVYRDQLREVERDRARGLIGADEAERMRTEVSRRILAADARQRAGGSGGGQPRAAGWALAALAVIGLTGGAGLLYDRIGSPGYRDLPIARRLAASEAARTDRLSQAQAEASAPAAAPSPPPEAGAEYLALVERLRAAVANRPDDLRGLRLLVRNEAALGNFAAAHAAQARVIEIEGDGAQAWEYGLWADLMVSAARGYVSQEAETAIRAALERDAREPRARYYLGLYLMQVDRPDAAFRTWEGLLNDSAPDAPWVPLIRGQIEEVAWRAGIDYRLPPAAASPEVPGPDAAAIDAAGDMTDAERTEMIRGMVEGLAARLNDEGGSAREWARLIAAYGVLDRREDAQNAWEEAKAALAGQEAELLILDDAARRAGLIE